ncbi:hypothetical protein ALP75_201377 [Pseudomonas syringae pv. actinidiae]|nr:hypothetical protein ALP75_201377 [Pseudomonas syringae pv. actinidiae]
MAARVLFTSSGCTSPRNWLSSNCSSDQPSAWVHAGLTAEMIPSNCATSIRSVDSRQIRSRSWVRSTTRCSSVSLSVRRASSAFLSWVMSRDTHRIFSGLPSLPKIGPTCTCHHLTVPAMVCAEPIKLAFWPARAASTAAMASRLPWSCQKSGQGQPTISLKSLTSMTRWPPSLMKVRRESRSSTLMQSLMLDRTRLVNASFWDCRA